MERCLKCVCSCPDVMHGNLDFGIAYPSSTGKTHSEVKAASRTHCQMLNNIEVRLVL